jgi:hypothetical protein
MNHDEAVRLSLVEKYLLAELPPDLRDEFEDHYFDCPECAADLRATSAFLDAAKHELKAAPLAKPASEPVNWNPAKKSRFSRLWVPILVVPALAACLLVIAYENLAVYPHYRSEIAQLKAPEILPSISLAGGNSRGGAVPSATVQNDQPFLVQFDIPTQERFSSYTCLLYSPTGLLVWRIPVSAESAKDTVSVRVPAASGKTGTYTLVVQGNTGMTSPQNGVDLAHYHFTLNSQD